MSATTDETVDDAQAYIDRMAATRGYVLDYHKVMAAADFDVLEAANNLVSAAYLKPRTLDPKVKELLFILSLVVMRATPGHIKSHIHLALELGATPEEILEAIEISLPEAGVVVFQEGVKVWAEAVQAARLEPTVEVFEGGAQ